MYLYCILLLMSTMAHGGDAGGDPPPHGWHPASTHITATPKKGRGKTANLNLRTEFERNSFRPLPIEFDLEYSKTNLPVGKYGKMFINLIGSLLHHHSFPRHFPSWNEVPAEYKTEMWRTIQQFFNMDPWFADGDKKRKVMVGCNIVCQKRYGDAKFDFKRDQFTARGGYENVANLRESPPDDCPQANWDKFLDYTLQDSVRQRCTQNASNRKKQVVKSRYGSKSYAARLYEERDEYPEGPRYIHNYEDMHVKPDGQWTHPLARSNHEQMSSLSQSTPGVSEEQVLLEVLGPRRGHVRGVGPKTPLYEKNAHQPSSSSSSAGGATSRPQPDSGGLEKKFADALQRFAADNNLRVTPELLASLMSTPSSTASQEVGTIQGENEQDSDSVADEE